MGVIGLDIEYRRPLAGGSAFDSTGPYEELRGVITFAADPEHEDYLARVRTAGEALVRNGYMLEEDVERTTIRAAARWDWSTGA